MKAPRFPRTCVRLTADQVVEIRNSIESGPVLAQKYGVCKSTINYARNGHNWKELPPSEYDSDTLRAKRFWKRASLVSSGCIEWTGRKNQGGYGRIRWYGQDQPVHRIAWQLVNGPIPDGMWVLHHCDNPPCVNPEHLFLGDREKNIEDMMMKGRQVKGEQHADAKLTEGDVVLIRMWDAPQLAIGRVFGVSGPSVWAIKSGKTWKHVPCLSG